MLVSLMKTANIPQVPIAMLNQVQIAPKKNYLKRLSRKVSKGGSNSFSINQKYGIRKATNMDKKSVKNPIQDRLKLELQ